MRRFQPTSVQFLILKLLSLNRFQLLSADGAMVGLFDRFLEKNNRLTLCMAHSPSPSRSVDCSRQSTSSSSLRLYPPHGLRLGSGHHYLLHSSPLLPSEQVPPDLIRVWPTLIPLLLHSHAAWQGSCRSARTGSCKSLRGFPTQLRGIHQWSPPGPERDALAFNTSAQIAVSRSA